MLFKKIQVLRIFLLDFVKNYIINYIKKVYDKRQRGQYAPG